MNRIMCAGLAAVLSGLTAIAASTRTDAFAPSLRAPGQPRPKVFVVAVRESRLLTMCPDIKRVQFAGGGEWTPDGRVMVFNEPFRDGDLFQQVQILPHQLPSDRVARLRASEDPRLWSRLSGARVTLPRPAAADAGVATAASLLERIELGRDRAMLDRAVRDAITREFRRLDRYEVVESEDVADFVFFAETSYAGQTGASSKGVTSIQLLDVPQNVRQSVLAIMVPAQVYRRKPADIDALLRHRIWEGSELMQRPYRHEWVGMVNEERYLAEQKTFESASPMSLVRQLHGKEKRVPSHPVLCSASIRPFVIETSVTAADPTGPAPPLEPAPPAAAGSRQPSAATFQVTVTYVRVHVAVTGAARGEARDLSSSEFRVYEDDVEQKIDRVLSVSVPFDMAVLVDTSTSMGSNVAQTQDALLAFLVSLRLDDQLMLLSFDRLVFLHADMTKDRTRIRQGIFQLDRRHGTRLYDAIQMSVEKLPPRAERRAIVLVTDGIDTESRLAGAPSVLAWALESDVPVYTIQVEAAARTREGPFVTGQGRPTLDSMRPPEAVARARQFLEKIATSSGGQIYRASTTDGLSDALQRVAHDLSVQYTLCYYPTNQAQDGTYRRIRVEATRPGTTTRTRAGYRATRQP